MRLPNTVTTELLRSARPGDAFVCRGHRTSAGSIAFRLGFSFTTTMGWMIFKPSIKPIPVTVITITERPLPK